MRILGNGTDVVFAKYISVLPRDFRPLLVCLFKSSTRTKVGTVNIVYNTYSHTHTSYNYLEGNLCENSSADLHVFSSGGPETSRW
jgi:hypothetical protein